MMAVVGTLAFNFQTVFPLFVTRDLGGVDTTFTLLFSVVSVGSLVGALRHRPPHATSASAPVERRRARLRRGAGGLAFAPNVAVAVRHRRWRWACRASRS